MSEREDMDQDVSRWDNVAEEYSQWIEGGQDIRGRAFTDVVNEAALQAMGNVRSLRVLDLGCGEGQLARELISSGADVSGIDGAPRMVEIAISRSSEYDIDFRVGLMTSPLPFEDQSFDAVLCNMVLMDLEDIESPFREVGRILKPRGKFVFSVVHPCYFEATGDWLDADTSRPLFRPKARYTEQTKFKKRLPGLSTEVELIHYHRPIQDYVRLLVTHGFCVTDFIETSLSGEHLGSSEVPPDLMRYHLTANNLVIGAVKLASDHDQS